MEYSQSQIIAGVYGQALAELAGEQGQGRMLEVSDELGGIVWLMDKLPEWAVFLENPAIGSKEKTKTIEHIFAGRISRLTMNLLGVLAQKGRLILLREIYSSYKDILDKQAGILHGSVVTAYKLDSEQQDRIVKRIGKLLGKKLKMQFSEQPEITGGMILNINNKCIDGSINNQLHKMKQQLYRNVLKQAGSI